MPRRGVRPSATVIAISRPLGDERPPPRAPTGRGRGPLDSRRQLIGAYFTQEYAIEGAALFNPSLVEHPDQSGLDRGLDPLRDDVPRAVGEGHISSVELRSGVVEHRRPRDVRSRRRGGGLADAGDDRIYATTFLDQLRELGGDHANTDFVLDALPATFTRADLDVALRELRDQRLTRGMRVRTIDRFERIAASNYAVEFPVDLVTSGTRPDASRPVGEHGHRGRPPPVLRRGRTPELPRDVHRLRRPTISSQLLRTHDFRRFA